MNRTANVEGFTLIEVLISVFLLSVGLLAVAAMQTTAMAGGTSSKNTTLSTQLAEEMIDRIRANGGDTPGVYHNLNTGTCTVNPVGDCNLWRDRLKDSGLPGAVGTVSVVSDSPITRTATITVTITWGLNGTKSMNVTTIMETWLT